MKNNFDYQGAKEAGYNDEEITAHLSEKHPKFDIQAAQEAGYSPGEINEHLSVYKPKKSLAEKSARIATQFGLGVLEGTPSAMTYEAAVAPLGQKEAQTVKYREGVFEDIERLSEQKQTGVWDQQDQELLDNLIDQVKNPEKMDEFVQTADISPRGLLGKATGKDLHPEGILEKAANWAGFIKNPQKLKDLFKFGLKPKDIIKSIAPSGTDTLRGLGAGTALQMAEEGDLGPIGTMAAAIAGDIIGGGTSAALKGTKELITKPKETLAKVAASFTPKEKVNLQKEIIKEFRDSGIQADVGTITDSNLLKWTQSRLAQSGLTGKALDEFKHELTGQIKEQYHALAESLGEARFASNHEAGEVAKSWMKSIRDSDLAEIRKLYEGANKSLKEGASADSRKLADMINKLEKNLKPGQLKSNEQTSVLSALEKLKRDIYDSEGNLLYGKVKDLINNKIAINDIINYEVQGGAKQLLKGIVSEIDRAIISHGKENPKFSKNFVEANKRFSQHAKTFRNKVADQMLRAEDPSQIINKMNSVQGIRSIEKMLSKNPAGSEIFDSLKRLKLDKVIGDNLINSTSQQAKLGTFSKLLEKGKNKEIIKEVLGSQSFKRLERLQKNAGRLADAADKFYNASKSGVVAADAAILAKGLGDIAAILAGNPWPLLKTATGILGSRKLSNLLADPTFLKLVEDVILSSEKGGQKELFESIELLRPYLSLYIDQSNGT